MLPTGSLLPVPKSSFDRGVDEPPLPARLTIGPHSGRGPVDGAWWPYSYDASTEFPALVAALAVRIGRVERIGYDMDLWHAAVPTLICGGAVVHCEGFHVVFSRLISVISGPGSGLIVLLIAPETGNGMARAAMDAAAEAAPGDTIENILDSASTNR